MGKNQSVTDQLYGPDPKTGKKWGAQNVGWQNLDTGDKWVSVASSPSATDRTIVYNYELDNGKYILEVAMMDLWWNGRLQTLTVNGVLLDKKFVTTMLPQVVKHEIDVTNGEMKVVIESIHSNNEGALVSWIRIGQTTAGKTCYDPTCEKRTTLWAELNKPSGIETAFDQESFVLYPNPSNGPVKMAVNPGVFKTYEIFDMAGKLLVSDKITSNEMQINANGLKGGIYLVKVKGTNNVKVQKLMIQR
jgi:hypothetical protein